RMIGYLLVGAMMAGCFVPIAYGVAKVYEDENQVKLSINVKEKPEVVFAKAAASIEEKGIWQIAKRDDEKMVLDLKKGEQKGYLKVAKLSGEGTSVMNIAVEKGKDPEAQKKALLEQVLDTCSKLGFECTEAKK
ncbi:MAG: hypothetical protein ACWGPR_11770, partial [Candidatus Deferrimicrobiaceae bacterium]